MLALRRRRWCCRLEGKLYRRGTIVGRFGHIVRPDQLNLIGYPLEELFLCGQWQGVKGTLG